MVSRISQSRLFTLVSIFGLTIFGSKPLAVVHAQDWPQILGAQRNATVSGADWHPADWNGLAEVVWQQDLGSGYSGVAIQNGLVLALHRKRSEEFISAFDLDSGKSRWEASWPSSYVSRINPDNGPRSVPAISEGRIVGYGAAGDLACVDLNSGMLLWKRSLRDEYDADDGYFGAGSSPLIIAGRVIVCLGGQQAGIIAVDLDSGKTVWKATTYDASYASPIAISSPRGMRLLVVTRLQTVLLDAEDGTVLSEVRFGARGPTVNAATPIRLGDRSSNRFLLTASYSVGCVVLSVENDQLVEQVRDRGLLTSQYNTPIQSSGVVFGIQGREDVGVASLRAIDPVNQNVLWETSNFGTAHLIKLKNFAVALKLDGELVAFATNKNEYRQLGRLTLPSGTYRSLPAISGNRLLVRATLSPNSSRLYCLQIP